MSSALLDTCRGLTSALASANGDAWFNNVPDQCTQAVMNAVINLNNSCQSSDAFPFALSNSLPAKAGLGSPNYGDPASMQAFCQSKYGISLNIDGSVAPPASVAPTRGVVAATTTGNAGSLITSSTTTSSRPLTSSAAPSQPATTGGSGGFVFPPSTGNSQNSVSGETAAQAQGISGGAIAGIVVGVLVLLGLVGGLVYWFRPKKDTSDMERLDVGPLPATSQFNASNPAYHAPRAEPPNVAAYHYQQQPQQQQDVRGQV
ncbi:hypothetical protein HDU81_005314 [Chytriomyces hyalinus]|nr:hypothetical protein HDU81_005314 [Chytriomyces hyalinus]